MSRSMPSSAAETAILIALATLGATSTAMAGDSARISTEIVAGVGVTTPTMPSTTARMNSGFFCATRVPSSLSLSNEMPRNVARNGPIGGRMKMMLVTFVSSDFTASRSLPCTKYCTNSKSPCAMALTISMPARMKFFIRSR